MNEGFESRNTLRVMVFEPGKQPEVRFIEDSLEAMQALVDGYIECLYLDSDTVLVCDEEGKLKGRQPNRKVPGDIIVGTFFLVGEEEGNFISLTDEQIGQFRKEWRA